MEWAVISYRIHEPQTSNTIIDNIFSVAHKIEKEKAIKSASFINGWIQVVKCVFIVFNTRNYVSRLVLRRIKWLISIIICWTQNELHIENLRTVDKNYAITHAKVRVSRAPNTVHFFSILLAIINFICLFVRTFILLLNFLLGFTLPV